MKKIVLGLVALVALASVLGARTHWLVGVAIVAVPVLMTYARLKLSPAYRSSSDQTMRAALRAQDKEI